jgi:hypothetical protein
MVTNRHTLALALCLLSSLTAGAQNRQPAKRASAIGAAFPTADALRYYSQHGRWPTSPSPFVIMHGPHGYHIQFLGVTETAAITKEHEGMLGRLCKIKETWCLPK